MLRDPVTAAFGLLLLAGFGFVVKVIRDGIRATDLHEPMPPTSDPISHMTLLGVDLTGRPYKVGVDHHSGLCVDAEGRVECICGLADREAEARGGAA